MLQVFSTWMVWNWSQFANIQLYGQFFLFCIEKSSLPKFVIFSDSPYNYQSKCSRFIYQCTQLRYFKWIKSETMSTESRENLHYFEFFLCISGRKNIPDWEFNNLNKRIFFEVWKSSQYIKKYIRWVLNDIS